MHILQTLRKLAGWASRCCAGQLFLAPTGVSRRRSTNEDDNNQISSVQGLMPSDLARGESAELFDRLKVEPSIVASCGRITSVGSDFFESLFGLMLRSQTCGSFILMRCHSQQLMECAFS